MEFQQLGMIPALLRALREAGYRAPTPIQERAIPPVLAGKDLLGCAQTGTGKTAAFAVPILQRLAQQRPQGAGRVRALILTPTRELALQIHESFLTYGRYLPLRCCVVFGGVSQRPQEQALRAGADILVATPGRLNDLINQGIVHLDAIEIFVLDEADRMLDMGFIHDVKRVIAKLPQRRQTLLFSATMPPEIAAIVDAILCQPVKIAVAPVSSAVDTVSQCVYFVDRANKRRLLLHLLSNQAITSALVFTRTKHGADRVAKELSRAGISAQAIHGDKSQGARQGALANFKNGKLRILVATDIAARGIDIEELPYVFNFELPEVAETYVHRIGRTGRAGQRGKAVAFCDFDEKPLLQQIEKLMGKKVPVIAEHPFPMEVFTPREKPQPRPPRSREEKMAGNPAQAQRGSQPKSNARHAGLSRQGQGGGSAVQNRPAQAARDMRQRPPCGQKATGRMEAPKQAQDAVPHQERQQNQNRGGQPQRGPSGSNRGAREFGPKRGK